MKSITKKRSRTLSAIGMLLIAGAVLLTSASVILQKVASDKSRQTVSKIYSLIPDIQKGVMDDRMNVKMPLLEIDGYDFAGVIEIPAYNSALPVYGGWDKGKISFFPCLYTGSIYDGSLIIGGSGNAGQFDFMNIITEGDYVFITDMTGSRYSYIVTAIEITKDVSAQKLTSAEADLVIFARNTYSANYTVVGCTITAK